MKTSFPVMPTSSTASTAAPVAAQIAIFRECYSRYQECLEFRGVPTQSDAGESIENFILDFELTGRKLLGATSAEYRTFSLRYLQGRSAQDCCRRLSVERFTLAQQLRSIESVLGNAFAERGLFPLASYFGEGVKGRTGSSYSSPERLAA